MTAVRAWLVVAAVLTALVALSGCESWEPCDEGRWRGWEHKQMCAARLERQWRAQRGL